MKKIIIAGPCGNTCFGLDEIPSQQQICMRHETKFAKNLVKTSYIFRCQKLLCLLWK